MTITSERIQHDLPAGDSLLGSLRQFLVGAEASRVEIRSPLDQEVWLLSLIHI